MFNALAAPTFLGSIYAPADGAPHSQVCARLTLSSAPIDISGNFSLAQSRTFYHIDPVSRLESFRAQKLSFSVLRFKGEKILQSGDGIYFLFYCPMLYLFGPILHLLYFNILTNLTFFLIMLLF
jgi:hypothetical protein